MGHEMSGDGEQPAAEPDWARLRQDYEAGTRPVAAIARDAGITAQKLTAAARRQAWTPRPSARPRSQTTRDTIRRLKALLQQRLAELEGQIASLGAEATAASSERDIRAMNTLVRTLEKVLELERKDRATRAKRRREYRQFDDAEREALARKLDGLREELADAADPEADERPGGAGV